MDPKLSNLDPKLQDAYNRVMSGPDAPPPPSSGATTPPPPQPAQAAPAPQTPAPQSTQPASPAQPTLAQPQFGSTLAFNSNNTGKNLGTVGTIGVKKGGSKIMPIILGLGIIVFLIAYTFVWIYFFKLKIPYLPQF